MSELLPRGWAEVPIGTFARIVGGGTPPSKNPVNFVPVGQGVPWITPADLSGYRAQTIERGARDLSSVGLAACGATLMPKGAVLFSSRAPIGYVAIAASEISTNQGFKSFVLPDGFDPRFTYYQLKHLKPEAEAIATGTTFKELSGSAAATLPVKIAPRNEQTRIADQLDKLLARIQSCNDRLDAIPALLKRFRQAVLDAAVTGSLSEEWRSVHPLPENAAIEEVSRREQSRQVVHKIRGERANVDAELLFKLPPSWTWVVNHRLAKDDKNAICAGPFGTIFKAKDFRESGVPIVFLRHIGNGQYLTHKPTFMEKSVWEKHHQLYSIFGGELLVTKLGDPPGTACIYPPECGTAMVTPDVMKMNVDDLVAEARYLMYFFNAPVSKAITEALCFGVTRLRIDLSMFKTFPVPLPPREEQREIVRRVEALFKLADRIEACHKATRTHALRITPLLLAKAFRGELVQQDPRDEPATVLLERIAATLPNKARISRGRPRIKSERQLPLPELNPSDWASWPDGAWAAPADPDGHTAMVWVTAVLRAWGKPMPEREARLAALFCLQPRLFTPVLPVAEAKQWSRLVGDEARPLPTQVLSFVPAINSHWWRAVNGMRVRGDLIEAGAGDGITWALGAGAASIETAGWPDGRAGFVVAYLRAHGMTSVLPMLEPSAQEFVDARAA